MPPALVPLRRCLALVLVGAGLVAGHLTLGGSDPAMEARPDRVSVSKASLSTARIANDDPSRFFVASPPDTLARLAFAD